MKKFFTLIIIFSLSFYFLIEFIGDRLIKNIIEKNISSSLSRDVSIEKLNIDYLSGKAEARDIRVLNKKFDGYLMRVNEVKVSLDTFSIFSNNILIQDVLLNDINVNYYFNFSQQTINDNVRSLQKDLQSKTSESQSSKYFNIKNLDAKNISISVLSPELNIEQTIKLNDRNFKDIGNTKNSKSYKETLKNIFKDTINIVKTKVLNNNLFDKLEKFDPKKIEDKVKDKLKNKLKKLIN
tara:strand:- start:628 stop:1341 length:714 start_codon:yes stop_codon:yes gene_type:complete